MRIRIGLRLLAATLSIGAAVLLAAALTRDTSSTTSVEPGHAAMRDAAQHFLSLLDDSTRAKTVFPFEAEERYNWHFVPRDREGLPFEEMTLEQRRAAHDLMRSALSSQGYLKATSIMRLESILRELENDPVRRNPERYYFTFFGTPASDQPWGWRLEGHHLSLNYSSITGDLLAVTPAFMGTNPAEVRTGPYAGLRVLGAEEDLGRKLMHSLTAAQQRKALITAEAPHEILTGNQRKAILETYEGLPASEMTPDQRDLLLRIIEEYAHNMRHDIAHEQMDKIRNAGIERLYFAWAGGLELGEPHYYRIHGPTVLFEYDNTQNNANHAHSVWRDLEGDFGEDLLREHYEQASADHGHDH